MPIATEVLAVNEPASTATATRRPAVAGAFYAAEPQRLQDDVRRFMAAARAAPAGSAAPPKALIVPHAGYLYSGPIAASAYATLRASAPLIERVVLFGPAHRVPLRGLAAPAAAAFATPLGAVSLDREALERASALPQVAIDDRPHAAEHSLEVQLPFLQQLLGSFRLAPFVVGDASPGEVAEVMELLWGGPETLIVVSSDLSHYYDYQTACRLDAATSRAIQSLDPSGLGPESACGRVPIRGLLVAARAHGLHVDVLDLRNSGDTAGSRDQVVGYGAFALRGPAGAATRAVDEAALDLARDAVEHSVLTGGGSLPLDFFALPAPLRDRGASFVTLERRGRLRGCVGELEGRRPLATSIIENAGGAALRDPRFQPLAPEELSDLRVKLSLIGPLEALRVSDRQAFVAALRPGIDGVLLTEGRQGATLLPSVWAHMSTAEAFADALEQKAGLVRGWSRERRVWTYRAREIG